MKVVKLDYYDGFHCIGAECRDSCCKHWHICLNKGEYFYYRNMDCSPKLRAVIDGAFTVTGESDVAYAEMRLQKNGECRFLGNDALCMIQKELGEEALCFTCGIFPRLHARVGESAVRQSCAGTCFHVTELLMNCTEGLRIVEEEYDGKNRYINKGLYSSAAITKRWRGFQFYWQLLYAEIDILRDRSFSVPERMLILGYFCQKADGYIKKDEPYKIPSLANMLSDKELRRKIAESLKPLQSDSSLTVKSMDILLKMYMRIKTVDSGLPKILFERVMKRLNYTAERKDNRNVANLSGSEYKKLCEVFRRIESERTYIIENLLVNLIFSSDPQQGVWANFFTLAVFYNTLKICAPVFLPKDYDDKELAAALTYAVKMVINTRLAEKGTLNDFAEENKNGLVYAAFLIC